MGSVTKVGRVRWRQMSKIVKPDHGDRIEVQSARHNMVSIIVRFVVILAVIVVILTLIWNR